MYLRFDLIDDLDTFVDFEEVPVVVLPPVRDRIDIEYTGIVNVETDSSSCPVGIHMGSHRRFAVEVVDRNHGDGSR